jgi:hypothetical protein
MKIRILGLMLLFISIATSEPLAQTNNRSLFRIGIDGGSDLYGISAGVQFSNFGLRGIIGPNISIDSNSSWVGWNFGLVVSPRVNLKSDWFVDFKLVMGITAFTNSGYFYTSDGLRFVSTFGIEIGKSSDHFEYCLGLNAFRIDKDFRSPQPYFKPSIIISPSISIRIK